MSSVQSFPSSPDRALAHFRKCYAEMLDAAELVRASVDGLVMHKRRKVDPRIAMIQGIVCTHYNIPLVALTCSRRTDELVEPRHVGMYLCRTLTDLSFVQVGAAFSRTHGAVCHATENLVARMSTDHKLDAAVQTLAAKASAAISAIEKKAS